MQQQSKKVITLEQCKEISLEDLEKYHFNGYELPPKYLRKVQEFREAYNIITPEQADDDYKLGLMQGEFERSKQFSQDQLEDEESFQNQNKNSANQQNVTKIEPSVSLEQAKRSLARMDKKQTAQTEQSQKDNKPRHSSKEFYDKAKQKELRKQYINKTQEEVEPELPDFNFKKKYDKNIVTDNQLSNDEVNTESKNNERQYR